MKKALCAAMALTLTMATAAPAFAADTTAVDDNTNVSITQDNNAISPRLVMNWHAVGSSTTKFFAHGDSYKLDFSIKLVGKVNDGTFSFSTLNKPFVNDWSTDYKQGTVSEVRLVNFNPVYTNGSKNVTFKSTLQYKVDGSLKQASVTISAYGGSERLTIS